MSAEPTRDLLENLTTVTNEMVEAIDRRTRFNNELAVAKADVEKCQHKKDLILQQLQVQKKLMDIR